MKILLAIDDSPGSEAATRAVIDQFSPQNTEVRVLHAVEPPSAFLKFVVAASEQVAGAPVDLAPELKAASERAQTLVAKAADELRLQGFKVTSGVEQGDPKSTIVDSAARWHADLIVVGAHGYDALEGFLMGSVSEIVARHANCSVEIVRLPRRTAERAGAVPQYAPERQDKA
jgi:nucleotide-binding universal stress UspA family protein